MDKEFREIYNTTEKQLLAVWKEKVSSLLDFSKKHPIDWGLMGEKVLWRVDASIYTGYIELYRNNEVTIRVSAHFNMSSFTVKVYTASPEITFGYCRSFPSGGAEFQVSPTSLARLLNDLIVIYP